MQMTHLSGTYFISVNWILSQAKTEMFFIQALLAYTNVYVYHQRVEIVAILKTFRR